MDKFEKAILNQLAGKKVSQDCPVCNKKTDFTINKNGTVTCTKCNTKGNFDLRDVAKGLKSIGVTVD